MSACPPETCEQIRVALPQSNLLNLYLPPTDWASLWFAHINCHFLSENTTWRVVFFVFVFYSFYFLSFKLNSTIFKYSFIQLRQVKGKMPHISFLVFYCKIKDKFAINICFLILASEREIWRPKHTRTCLAHLWTRGNKWVTCQRAPHTPTHQRENLPWRWTEMLRSNHSCRKQAQTK